MVCKNFEAGDDLQKLSYIVDLTQPLIFVYNNFLYFILVEKPAPESAYPNMEKAWLNALTTVCKDNCELAASIHSKVTAFVSWESHRQELKQTMNFLGQREIPNVYIFSGYLIRHLEPYFSQMITEIEINGIETNEKTKTCHLEALTLRRVIENNSSTMGEFSTDTFIDVLTFAYRGNRVVAEKVNDKVELFLKQWPDSKHNLLLNNS